MVWSQFWFLHNYQKKKKKKKICHNTFLTDKFMVYTVSCFSEPNNTNIYNIYNFVHKLFDGWANFSFIAIETNHDY